MITDDRWTCPDCNVTEQIHGPADRIRSQRLALQTGHAARHQAERSTAGPIAGALLDVAEELASFRIRLVVAPGDVERVRGLVVRRSLPVDVYADSNLEPGQGYVMQPRKGVRELHQEPTTDLGKDATS